MAADWRVRVMGLAVVVGWTAVACGSRTGDYLGPGFVDGDGFGPGGSSGAGGLGASSNDSVAGVTQASAVVTVGGPAVTVSTIGGTTAGGDCVPGVCRCNDCISACTCNGSSLTACEQRCANQAVSNSGFGMVVSGSVGSSSFVSGAGGFFGFTSITGSTAVSAGGVGGAPGSCCEVSNGRGCDDPDVARCVCDTDPFCCQYLWDGFCVQEVESLGCGTCETGTGTGMQSAVTGVGGAATAVSTTGEGGAGGVAECVAQSQSNCEACLCSDCFQAYGDCVGDFGCPRILECMDDTGCTGLDCYAPDTCQLVIDRFGGLTGTSVAYVTGIVECAVAASCPCP